MARQLRIVIRPDGVVQAETLGIHGEACLGALPILEQLLQAQAVASEFTADYALGQEQTLSLPQQQRVQDTLE